MAQSWTVNAVYTCWSLDGQMRLPVGLQDGRLDRLTVLPIIRVFCKVEVEDGLFLNTAAPRHEPACEAPHCVGVCRVSTRCSEARCIDIKTSLLIILLPTKMEITYSNLHCFSCCIMRLYIAVTIPRRTISIIIGWHPILFMVHCNKNEPPIGLHISFTICRMFSW